VVPSAQQDRNRMRDGGCEEEGWVKRDVQEWFSTRHKNRKVAILCRGPEIRCDALGSKWSELGGAVLIIRFLATWNRSYDGEEFSHARVNAGRYLYYTLEFSSMESTDLYI
jgi:hypothetical protein